MFLALLTNELRSDGDRAGLREVVTLADSGQITIVTSTIAMAEVLGECPDDPIRERLELLFQRPNFIRQDANAGITYHAGTIRARSRVAGRSIKTPDATFIATALAHRVDALHTFDDQLLNLSGDPLIEGLRVTRPHGTQMLLNFESPYTAGIDRQDRGSPGAGRRMLH